MPYAPKKPCSQPGCPNLVSSGYTARGTRESDTASDGPTQHRRGSNELPPDRLGKQLPRREARGVEIPPYYRCNYKDDKDNEPRFSAGIIHWFLRSPQLLPDACQSVNSGPYRESTGAEEEI